jgi:hypothetical protein
VQEIYITFIFSNDLASDFDKIFVFMTWAFQKWKSVLFEQLESLLMSMTDLYLELMRHLLISRIISNETGGVQMVA